VAVLQASLGPSSPRAGKEEQSTCRHEQQPDAQTAVRRPPPAQQHTRRAVSRTHVRRPNRDRRISRAPTLPQRHKNHAAARCGAEDTAAAASDAGWRSRQSLVALRPPRSKRPAAAQRLGYSETDHTMPAEGGSRRSHGGWNYVSATATLSARSNRGCGSDANGAGTPPARAPSPCPPDMSKAKGARRQPRPAHAAQPQRRTHPRDAGGAFQMASRGLTPRG